MRMLTLPASAMAPIVFAGAVAMRWSLGGGIPATPVDDTAGYLKAASLSLFDPAFYATDRAFTVPLFYKLCQSDPAWIGAFQSLFSALAWTVLGLMAARAMRSRLAAVMSFVVVLLFGSSAEIMGWDRVMWSESISISLFALCVAAALWLWEGWSWLKVCPIALVAFLWVFARDGNAYSLAMVGGLLGAAIVARLVQPRYLIVAGAFGAIALASTASADAGARWQFPFYNVVGQRILPDAYMLSLMEKEGMPSSPALMRLSGGWATSANYAFFTDPDLEPFRQWVRVKGKSAYMKVLATHLPVTIRGAATYMPDLIWPTVVEGNGNRMPVASPLVELTYPSSETGFGIWAMAAALLSLCALLRARTLGSVWVLPLVMLLLVFPIAVIVFHGDPMEIPRHSIQTEIQFRLAVWLMVLMAVDALVMARTNPGVQGTTTVPNPA
jgi:hypothetical protein